MEIHYNEEFGSYEVTKCDSKFGKSITLDGEPMIPASALEAYKIAIKEKIKHETLNIIDNTNINEKCKTDPVTILHWQGILDCYNTLKDIYMCPNVEDFMIETFGYLIDVSEMIFKTDDPEKLITQFKAWQEKEKDECSQELE